MGQEFEYIFKKHLDNETFVEVLQLIKENSEGKIWIMGGFVYRNLVKDLYGNNNDTYTNDIDFLVEKKNDALKKIPDWEIYTNSYGSENYANIKTRTSFTELGKAIRMSELTCSSIEDFLYGTPLTIQSIAYDIETGKLIGEKGIQAILNRTVAVNDKQQAEFYAQRKKKTIDQILKEKAFELNFTILK